MGESVLEAVVLNWFVQEGTPISEGDPLLAVATDKVDAEVPAVCTGIVKKLLVQKGAVVAVGAPIALLEAETEAADSFKSSHAKEACASPAIEAVPLHPIQKQPIVLNPLTTTNAPKLLLSPLVKRMVQEHNIQPEELAKLVGSAKDNRITQNVLLDYLAHRSTVGTHRYARPEQIPPPLEGDVCIRMDRVRKLIAERMVQSKAIAPHVTSFIRADITELVSWRNQHKAAFEKKYGIKLTYMPFFMMAIARSLQAFPLLNAVVVGDEIRKRKHINMGFAVALPDGNLMVPVVKQVETLTFVALAKKIDGLIQRARNGTMVADELTDASYTISNIGSFDNLMGTPIIVQPQVAILAVGAIERRPAVVTNESGETIVIRDEMFLSHTYDHRIIDGAVGGGFLKHLTKELLQVIQNDLVDF
jgi:2-oxoglutarate dehydrogenase E2 component (dihydrolipoamide succinyltransferase)